MPRLIACEKRRLGLLCGQLDSGISVMSPAAAVRPAVLAPAILALTVLALAAPALAKGPPVLEGRPAALKAVVDCRAISDPSQRLACYDDAVGKLDTAESSGQVVVLDREAAKTVKRQAFGFSIPSINLFSKGEKEEEVNRLSDTIKSARERPDHRWVIELQTGGVWRQIDTTQFPTDPKPGQAVEIQRAALGSYMLKIDGHQPAIRVHRDD
jgi:hypothetical protein